MTDKEKQIYGAFNDAAFHGVLSYSKVLSLPVMKQYSYENRKKILSGMVRSGIIKFNRQNGYITTIEILNMENVNESK